MFIKPSKIKRNKILRNRTISFETPKKTHGNMVLILSDDQDAILKTIDSKLFRPMQLLAFYTPRRIKAMGKSPVIVNQKDYYKEVREKTHGRIKRGKTLLSTYNGINVVYDIANEYKFVNSVYEERHIAAQRRQALLSDFMKKKISEVSSNGDYTNTYLIFPLVKPYPKNKVQRIFVNSIDRTTFDPLFLFLKSLDKGTVPVEYKNVDLVVFYIPDSDIMLVLDLKSPTLEADLKGVRQKLRRLNNYLDGEDDLSDELAESDAEENNIEDEETRIENTKEIIKNAVLTKVAKTIDAKNLTDFEAATSQEQDVMIEIDKKVDDFLAKPENLSKSVSDLAAAIETDNDVKEKALRYVENKKAAATRLNTLAKGLEKETEIINSIEDLKDDEDKSISAAVMKTSIKDMDPRIDQSVLGSIDEEYNKKQMREDIINVISAFSNNEFSPMTVESLNFEDTSDYQNARETVHVKYKTDDNRQVSFSIDIPKIVDKRFFFLGGGKKFIKKQLLRLPIVKTKPDRVEIVTAVNKMTFERSSGKLSRKNEYLLKKLKEMKDHPGFSIEYSDNSLINSKMGYSNDFEYEELACSIGKITSGKYQLIFNRDDMKDEIFILDIPDSFINDKRTPIGFINLGSEHKALIYIENGKIYAYNIETKGIMQLADSLFGFLVNTVLNLDMSKLPTIGRSFIFTSVKYLGVTYPLLSVLGSQVGLTNLLKRYKINYYISKKPKKNVNYVEVRFQDNYLYYEDTIRNTLLLNSIYLLHPEEYPLFKFDGGEPYTDYFCRLFGRSIGQHSRTRLRMNLGVMLDPITHEILLDLRQPSNIIDMCLEANSLLVGNQYRMINDIHNYRVRSNEVVASVLYRIIAEAYVNYQEHKMNGNPINLSIPRGLLIKELLSLQNINDKSTLNPFLEAEQIAQISAKGEKGINLDKAYTNEMRVVDESINGFISGNSTPYSGSAGITRALVYDPKINSIRGYIPEVDTKTLSATNLLSPTELLSPFTAAQADPPRQAMQISQSGHMAPILKPSKQLIGTGVNKTLAFLLSNDFCFKAAKDGRVAKIDRVNNVVILQYIDGTKDAIDIGVKLDKNSNMGFYIHQEFKLVYNEGEAFKAGDVLAYNPLYFRGKGRDVDFCPGTLTKVAIAPGDFSFEDSTLISESLSERCAIKVNMLKQIALPKTSILYDMVDVGDKVNTGDVLLEYSNGFEDPAAMEFLKDLEDKIGDSSLLTHDTVESKVGGEITKITVLYNCPFEELDPSLQKLIQKYRARSEGRIKATEGIYTGNVKISPVEQVDAIKDIKKEFPVDGGVIVNIWVEYIDKLGPGDKMTYSTALKGVVSRIVRNDETPIDESDPDNPIEAILTPTGVISRMTFDVYSMLWGNSVLVNLGKQIREIWKGER